MKCVNEADDCSTDSNPPTGSSSATTGEGVPDSTGTMPPKVARCVRCDKDLGFYLFRDKCVRTCPQ